MPKKAKKGGAGKGGGKTEEERLLFLQQRAQAEEEMAKKKEEILTLFLKDKLQKEERNTSLNLLKLNELWRSNLRLAKAAELRHDSAVLRQTSGRQLDSLDNTIKGLERDLEDAERQAAQAWRLHLQHMERLWAQRDKQMFVLQQWRDSLQQLQSRLSSEREQMLTDWRLQRADLEDIKFTAEQLHRAAMEEIVKAYSESTNMLACNQNEPVSEDGDRLTDIMPLENKRRFIYDVKYLLLVNKSLLQTIKSDQMTLKMLQGSISKQRAKVSSSEVQRQLVEQDLTHTRDQMIQRTRRLQDQLIRAQKALRSQLTGLAVQSAAATKKLQAIISQSERFLYVAEMCKRLESEQSDAMAAFLFTEEGRQIPEGASEFPELPRVTRRINVALLQREALRRRKEELDRENQQLKLLLRQHLDAMTLSDTLDGHRAPVLTGAVPADTGRRRTVVEAAHAVQHSL